MDAIIQVEHLAKRYRTSVVPAVDDISFEVHPGELFAFLGTQRGRQDHHDLDPHDHAGEDARQATR